MPFGLFFDYNSIGGKMEILKKFNIITNNKQLYEQAFSHSSFCNEQGLKNNYERLEFLGDAVLDLIISEYLYQKFYLEEGKMSKLRARYVCEKALSEYALSLNFNKYIKVGKGEKASGGQFKKAILADTFEAFIGALYLDQGLNQVKSFVKRVIIPIIEDNKIDFFYDYKSSLQELAQVHHHKIEYEVINQIGPSHNRKFTVIVKIDGFKYGVGIAKSKREAEQEAAKNALLKKIL